METTAITAFKPEGNPSVRTQGDTCNQNAAYVFDGTLEGLLSAVFAAYSSSEKPSDILCGKELQPRLGQTVITVETNLEHAFRVQRGICARCGPIVFEAVKSTSLSDDPAIGTIIYRFLRYAFSRDIVHDCHGCPQNLGCGGLCSQTRKHSPLNDIAHHAVAPFIEANRRVYNEREKVLQFLRFAHLEGDVWFARCNPNASVVPLVMDWFAGRFNTQAFMIYDEAHHLAGVYEGKDWFLVKTDHLDLPEPSHEEAQMAQAWKRFYRTIAVESRFNPELRQSFMPKRLWKNITEMQEDLPASPTVPRGLQKA
ncbi:MAG: TIGR03915 family putative DNA repair protein [Coriobacteriaceae bacterium]|jgi:hypothetical protein|nr:TIGR03915 family putative DNA repair protein [Coriobacteriaceae bacterium]